MEREKVGGRNGNMNFEVIRFSFFFFFSFRNGGIGARRIFIFCSRLSFATPVSC